MGYTFGNNKMNVYSYHTIRLYTNKCRKKMFKIQTKEKEEVRSFGIPKNKISA